MIGETVSHYRITGKLGAGGMGEVYRAEDSNLHRHVASKVLPDEFAHDAERLAQREAEVLASLNHPNIATLYGLEESDGKRAAPLSCFRVPADLADDCLPIWPLPQPDNHHQHSATDATGCDAPDDASQVQTTTA